MKHFSFILLLIGGLLLVNIFSLSSFFVFLEGKNEYQSEKYEEALGIFEQEYNKANALYKAKDFEQAQEQLAAIDTKDTKLQFKVAHNLGNVNYRLYEQTEDIEFLDASIESYKFALEIMYDEETQKNLEFVKGQKKKQQENQEDKEQEESKDKKSSKENSQGQKGDPQEEEKSAETKNDNGKGEDESEGVDGSESEQSGKERESEVSQKGEENKSEAAGEAKGSQEIGKENNNQNGDSQSGLGEKQGSSFTEQEQYQLEQYEQMLEQNQQQNSGAFGKLYDDPTQKTLHELFEGDRFFDDSFGSEGEIKDW